MLSKTILTFGMTLSVADTKIRILSVQGDRVTLALSYPEHLTVRIPDSEDSLRLPATFR